jgi:hypothetical protein
MGPGSCRMGLWVGLRSQSVDRRVGARHLESCLTFQGQPQTSPYFTRFHILKPPSSSHPHRYPASWVCSHSFIVVLYVDSGSTTLSAQPSSSHARVQPSTYERIKFSQHHLAHLDIEHDTAHQRRPSQSDCDNNLVRDEHALSPVNAEQPDTGLVSTVNSTSLDRPICVFPSYNHAAPPSTSTISLAGRASTCSGSHRFTQ